MKLNWFNSNKLNLEKYWWGRLLKVFYISTLTIFTCLIFIVVFSYVKSLIEKKTVKIYTEVVYTIKDYQRNINQRFVNPNIRGRSGYNSVFDDDWFTSEMIGELSSAGLFGCKEGDKISSITSKMIEENLTCKFEGCSVNKNLGCEIDNLVVFKKVNIQTWSNLEIIVVSSGAALVFSLISLSILHAISYLVFYKVVLYIIFGKNSKKGSNK